MTNDYRDLEYPTHLCDRAERDDRLMAHAERLAHNGVVSRPHHHDVVLSKRGLLAVGLLFALVLAVGIRLGGLR